MTNKTTILWALAFIFAAKGFLVFNAESLVLFTYVVFVAGMATHYRESVLESFAARTEQVKKEFYSARADVQSYYAAYSTYLRFELASLSALMVGVSFSQQASWASLARAQYRFKEQLRNQVVEKLKRVAVFESLGAVQLQSSIVTSVPSDFCSMFSATASGKESAAVQAGQEAGLSDSIEDLLEA
jgi:hypothetical protein